MTKEMLEKAKTAKSAEELLEMAKEAEIELSEEKAKDIFSRLNSDGELSDEELGAVAGGCGESYPMCPACYSPNVKYEENYSRYRCKRCHYVFTEPLMS